MRNPEKGKGEHEYLNMATQGPDTITGKRSAHWDEKLRLSKQQVC